MQEKIKYSILVPAFKRAYLGKCIESVLSQTYNNWELIIVDDDSPENLASVVGIYDDERIRYYRNAANCGAVDVVDNWNICLGYATGTYCICMGDDDCLLPDCLQEYDNLITRNPELFVYHAWTEIINEYGEVMDMQEPRPEREGVFSMVWNRWQGRAQFIGDFLFDVAVLRAEGGFYKVPMAWGSDDISAFRAAIQGGIANMQKPGFQYRVSSITISTSGNVIAKMQACDDCHKWYQQLLTNHKPEKGPETIFYKLCSDNLDKSLIKRKCSLISSDMADNGFRAFVYWLSNRHRYGLGLTIVAYAAILALKTKKMSSKKSANY